jgi:hypothetical protein
VADWEFLQDDGGPLLELIQKLNRRYDVRIQNWKEMKTRKAPPHVLKTKVCIVIAFICVHC